MKHTPGPWRISDAQIGYFVIVGPGCPPEKPERKRSIAYGSNDPRFYRGMPTVDYPVISVSEAIDTDFDLEQSTANARLIASAPDLLAALKEMLETCAVNLDDQEPEDEAIYERARAAIAKAEGREA